MKKVTFYSCVIALPLLCLLSSSCEKSDTLDLKAAEEALKEGPEGVYKVVVKPIGTFDGFYPHSTIQGFRNDAACSSAIAEQAKMEYENANGNHMAAYTRYAIGISYSTNPELFRDSFYVETQPNVHGLFVSLSNIPGFGEPGATATFNFKGYYNGKLVKELTKTFTRFDLEYFELGNCAKDTYVYTDVRW